MKYYYALDTGRLIAGVVFHTYDILGGVRVGVYATEDPKEIEALDKLVAVKDSSVRAIDQVEYDMAIKKKIPDALRNSEILRPPSPSAPTTLKGQGAAVVINEPEEVEKPVEIKSSVETVADALQLAEVKPIEIPQAEPPKKRKK